LFDQTAFNESSSPAIMLYVARVVVLSLTIVFSIIVLGLAADLTSTTETYLNGAFTFASLGIASAVISIVTLPVLLLVDVLRTGAFTSMIVVELPWLLVNWVLWLATGALTAQFDQLLNNNCNLVSGVLATSCHEVQGIEGFSFLNWLLLMVYSIVVLVMAIIGSTHGHTTWTSSVKHANFLGPSEGGGVPVVGQPAAPLQPPMQQQQYAQNVPVQGYPAQGYAVAPAPSVSPYHGTQSSHISQQASSQGPAYV